MAHTIRTRSLATAARLVTFLFILATCARGPTRQPTSAAMSTPDTPPAALGLTPEEYALACAHDPRARMRLYGCTTPYRPALVIVDGRVVSGDTSAAGRQALDSALATLRGKRLEEIVIFLAEDPRALYRYGSRAAGGAIVIHTRPDPSS